MESKINKSIILISNICTVIPFNIIIRVSDVFINYLILFLPMIIGYILYFTQYKYLSYRYKKLLYIAILFGIINLLSGFYYLYYNSENYSRTWNNLLTWSDILYIILFYSSYFIHRLLSLILSIKILTNKKI